MALQSKYLVEVWGFTKPLNIWFKEFKFTKNQKINATNRAKDNLVSERGGSWVLWGTQVPPYQKNEVSYISAGVQSALAEILPTISALIADRLKLTMPYVYGSANDVMSKPKPIIGIDTIVKDGDISLSDYLQENYQGDSLSMLQCSIEIHDKVMNLEDLGIVPESPSDLLTKCELAQLLMASNS